MLERDVVGSWAAAHRAAASIQIRARQETCPGFRPLSLPGVTSAPDIVNVELVLGEMRSVAVQIRTQLALALLTSTPCAGAG